MRLLTDRDVCYTLMRQCACSHEGEALVAFHKMEVSSHDTVSHQSCSLMLNDESDVGVCIFGVYSLSDSWFVLLYYAGVEISSPNFVTISESTVDKAAALRQGSVGFPLGMLQHEFFLCLVPFKCSNRRV